MRVFSALPMTRSHLPNVRLAGHCEDSADVALLSRAGITARVAFGISIIAHHLSGWNAPIGCAALAYRRNALQLIGGWAF